MEKVIVGLIAGRHPLPVSEYILDKVEDVHDYPGIRARICEFLDSRVGVSFVYGAGINQSDYTDVRIRCGDRKLVVYVTGLTPVTAELVSCCLRNGVDLTLMNYDTASGNYIPQEM